MATLVLTAVGTALGGPVGGALGSLVGQSVDQALLGPGMRKGPRLGDLAIQTSSYGAQVPRLYGTMRVAGIVIWATDLVEQEAIEGGGKGGPESIAYRYTASFAVALSSRSIRSVKRIWADGKLIRGAAEDFKVSTEFRLLTGDEDQAIDPLIASVETIDRAPAFRGLAVAIFENLDLSEFGNRIPMLTFEVEADPEGAGIGDILRDASDDVIDVADDRGVIGYAAHGKTVVDAMMPLIDAFGCTLSDDGAGFRGDRGGDAIDLTPEMLGCSIDDEGGVATSRERLPTRSVPDTMTVGYYDVGRDYQAGQARTGCGRPSDPTADFELPAVLGAGAAKALAEGMLARRWASRDVITVSLPPAMMTLLPGDRVRLPEVVGTYEVSKAMIEGLAVSAELKRVTSHGAPHLADGGRSVTQADTAIGRSVVALFEPPALDEETSASPRLLLAIGGDGAFKPVPVEISSSDGRFPVNVRRKAVLGQALNGLTAGATAMFDDRSHLDVQLIDPTQQLFNADANAMAQGANLAIIGAEVFQFARAEILAPGRYRLTRLLRGRFGTEWAAASHSNEEMFVLLDGISTLPVSLSPVSIGQDVVAVAHGVADRDPFPTTSYKVGGESALPMSPCHLRAAKVGGDLRLTWVRRSVTGLHWLDGSDVPAELMPTAFQVDIAGPRGTLALHSADQAIVIAQGELGAADLREGDLLLVSVMAVGSAGRSRRVSISVQI